MDREIAMRYIYIERAILIAVFFIVAMLLEGCSNLDQRYSDYYDGCARLGAEFVVQSPEEARPKIAHGLVRFCSQVTQERFSE
jgi:hypothetical protein